MVDDPLGITRASSGNVSSATSSAQKGRSNELGRDDFLKLLVTQLKQQDPLDPVKNEEFAVNLAQFSQLEQLVAIRNAVDGGGSSSSASGLAGYLGQQVTLSEPEISVQGGSADGVRVTLPSDAASAELVLSRDGLGVVERVPLGALSAGSQVISLEGLRAPPGDYKIELKGMSATGTELTGTAAPVGIVTGFIPGPEPKLVVGSREVALSQIARVDVPVLAGNQALMEANSSVAESPQTFASSAFTGEPLQEIPVEL